MDRYYPPQKGDKGDPGQSIVGPAGHDGSYSFEMPLGIGLQVFDTPDWSGTVAYSYGMIHGQNELSGLLTYKLGKDGQADKIKRLEARLVELTGRLDALQKPSEPTLKIKGSK